LYQRAIAGSRLRLACIATRYDKLAVDFLAAV